MNTIQINTKYLISLISLTSTIALVLIFSFFFGEKDLNKDIPDLIKQIIPNLLSSLIALLIVYFFIERKIDEATMEDRILSATRSDNENNFSVADLMSLKNLQEMESRLTINRQKLAQEIAQTLIALSKTEDTKQRESIENKLYNLYIKVNSIDEKVSIIKNRLSLSQKVDERDDEIRSLKNNISQLEAKINHHKITAQTIMEKAKQI